MARAKRTDRAEARRRHRATFADPLTGADGDVGAEAAPESGDRSRGADQPRAGAASTSKPAAQRPGLLNAFRSSFRPVDWRGDIGALPSLVRHWSFFVPVVLSGSALVLSQYFPKEPVSAALAGYFTGVTPLGSVFIAGLFARRASWLVGALVSISAALLLAFSLYVRYAGLPDGVFVDVGVGQVNLLSSTVVKAEIPDVILQALTAGAVYGAVFASAGAWYRRFLNRANPNRARPTTPTSRRPDGKVPRKNSQRPMLARRR